MMKFCIIFIIAAAVHTASAGPLKASFNDTNDVPRKDFFEDIIRDTLDMSVKELLVYTETAFVDLNRVTNAGVQKLCDDVLDIATSDIKAEIQKVKDDFIVKIFEIAGKLLVDLGKVLPKLDSVPRPTELKMMDLEAGPMGASDIILVTLGITLENFAIAIQDSFRLSSNLLTNTMVRFLELEKTARPEVAAGLRKISEEYLMEAKAIILPVLHDFEKLGV